MSRKPNPPEGRTRLAAPFLRRRGFSIVSAALILSWTVSACSGAVRVADPAATTGSAAPVSVEPQREWADAMVYFAVVDRFADGDPRNDFDVDRRAKGTFHGGDLAVCASSSTSWPTWA